MTASPVPVEAQRDKHLERDAVGLPAIVFQSVATMGPGVGVTYSIGVGALFAGGALPLSVFLALLACLLVALSIGQLARHLPSAGGPAAYTANGLHPGIGFLVAWGYSLTYFLAVPFLMLLIGYLLAGTLQLNLHWNYDAWWVIGALVGGALVFIINVIGIRISTAAGVIFGVIEIVIFLILSITLIIKAGGANTLAVFGSKFANVKGFGGGSGIVAGSVYAILAFIGFDAAAPLAEEAKNPRRSITYAVVGSTLLVGLFYVFCIYAATVYFGAGKFSTFTSYNNGNPWIGLAQSVWGGWWVIVFITLLNSAQANINGAANAGTRVMWSMGRTNVLPRILALTHPQWRSPYIATIITFVGGDAIALILGEKYGPTTAYNLLGTMIVALVIPVYVAVNLACVAYYWRFQRSEFNWLLHGLIPVAGIIVLIPAFFTALGITVFSFISPLTFPLNYAGPVVIAWFVLGIVWLGYLMARHPERVQATAHIFKDEMPEPDAPMEAQPAPSGVQPS